MTSIQPAVERPAIGRRDILRAACGGVAASFATVAGRVFAQPSELRGAAYADAAREAPDLPRPSAAQRIWQDCEIGLIYHFDMPVAAGVFAGNNTARQVFAPERYNPTRLDTDQWLTAAQSAGARYAIFTATHFNGFMQWQSDLYPYGVKQSPWRGGKGDPVADFVQSCRKVGIQPGIYFSTHRNVYWQVWGHYVDWGKGRGTPQQERFNRVAEQMTEELCSRYGPLVQIWYDAGVKTPEEGGPDVLPIFERHQPDSVFYHSKQRSDHRWIGNESGYAGQPCWATMPREQGEVSHNSATWRKCLLKGDPDGSYWSPGMVDVPLRATHGVHNWFWKPDQDPAAYTAEQLLRVYDQSVGRNCNLIIGEVVTSEGLVPESDIQRLAEFGRLLANQFARPVSETSGSGNILEMKWSKPRPVDCAVLMEDIEHGERVRQYVVEGTADGRAWNELSQGESIGHKWIVRFDRRPLIGLRLRVTRAAATPLIARLAAYASQPTGTAFE